MKSLSEDELADLAREVYQDVRKDSDAEISDFLTMGVDKLRESSAALDQREPVLRELLEHFGLADRGPLWARKVLIDNKIDLHASSPSFPILVGKARQAIQQALIVFVNGLADTPGKDVDPFFVDLDTGVLKPVKGNPRLNLTPGMTTLDVLVPTFLKETKASRGPKRVAKLEFTLGVVMETLGPRTDIQSIGRKDIIGLRSLLRDMPKNATKLYPGMTALQSAKVRKSEHSRRSIRLDSISKCDTGIPVSHLEMESSTP